MRYAGLEEEEEEEREEERGKVEEGNETHAQKGMYHLALTKGPLVMCTG